MENIKAIPITNYISTPVKKIGGGNLRLNPCPKCGHNDCCTIYLESNTFHCFSCNTGGSVIDFVMATSDGDFLSAAQRIATDNNIPFGEKNKDEIEFYNKKQQIFDDTADYFHQVLLKDKKQMDYFQNTRKRSLDFITKLKYGFADGKLHKYLLKKGYTVDELLKSGVVRKKDDRIYDFFNSGWYVYPLFKNGKISDFYVKKGKDSYQLLKSDKLRGVRFYGEEDLHKNNVIIVEGQEDRNTVKQISDEYNVVAILGNFTPDQHDILYKVLPEKNVFIAFDNDDTGRKYLDSFLERYSHLALVRVIEFPADYKDIDEYLRDKPIDEQRSLMNEMIETAEDIISYKIKALDIPENMNAKTAQGMYLPIIRVIAREDNAVAKDDYIERLAEKIGSKKTVRQAIRAEIRKLKKNNDEDIEEDFVPGSIVKRGCRYFRCKEKGEVSISNFIIKIKRYLEINEDLHYECTFKNVNGEESRLTIMSKVDRINKNRFREYIAGVGSYYFSGSEDDLSEIWQLEEAEALIEHRTCYMQRYGLVKDHNLWLFKNCAYRNGKLYKGTDEDNGIIVVDGVGYKSHNVKIAGNDHPLLNVDERPTKEYVDKVINYMWRMMDAHDQSTPKSFKGFIMMGFLASIPYLEEIVTKTNTFPYLLVYGAPEAGKSGAVQKLMNMIGYQKGGENWAEATPAGISQAMEELGSIPYWIEEFSNPAIVSSKSQNKTEILKNIYNRTSSGKGGLQNRQVREVNSSLIFTGQDRPDNQAFLTRCVVLVKDKPTAVNKEYYNYLQIENEYRRLSLVFRWLLETKTKERAKELNQNIQTWMSQLVKMAERKGVNIDDRAVLNISIFAASFSLFDYHKYDDAFADWVVELAIEDQKRKQSEDIIYRFFNDIDTIFSYDELVNMVAKDYKEDVVYMRFDAIYKAWVQMQRRSGMPENISQGGLLDYLKNAPEKYWLDLEGNDGKAKKYINGKQYRVIALMINKLPFKLKDIVETWLNTEIKDITGD